jgi:hypothetical protein
MSNIKTDSIPGGMVIENLGHTPVKVYSHTERLKIMRDRGLQERIEHVGMPGSDKSPVTQTWDVGLPPGVDGRLMSQLSPEEQEARHAEWMATEDRFTKS